MTENNSKSVFELFVELIKALAWPLFAAVLLISFWRPLQSIATQLPNILSRSETLTISGLTLKIGKGLNIKPSPEVKQALSKISPKDTEQLLNIGDGEITYNIGSESIGKAENAELVRLGLVEEMSESELRSMEKERGRRSNYGVQLTPLGKETEKLLNALIPKLVQELGRSGEEAFSKE